MDKESIKENPEIQMFLMNIKMFRTNLSTLTFITDFYKSITEDPPYKVEEMRKMILEAYNTYSNYMVKASGKMLNSLPEINI